MHHSIRITTPSVVVATTSLAVALSACSGTPAMVRSAQSPPNPAGAAVLAINNCWTGAFARYQAQMKSYEQSPAGFDVRNDVVDGRLDGVTMTLAPLRLGKNGLSPDLPVGPCQHIYRWDFKEPAPVDGVQGPFLYGEIDWNTEGLPRGPSGSFRFPHFDFHFYTLPKDQIMAIRCVPEAPTNRVCDSLKTDDATMRAFLDLVPAKHLPPAYRVDPGSSIPQMGLHYLDSSEDYTVDTVNQTPTIIYGGYAGKIVFLEAAVTIFTLHAVAAAPKRELSWPVPQPTEFWADIQWPTEFRIRYNEANGGFEASFTSFVSREAGERIE